MPRLLHDSILAAESEGFARQGREVEMAIYKKGRNWYVSVRTAFEKARDDAGLGKDVTFRGS